MSQNEIEEPRDEHVVEITDLDAVEKKVRNGESLSSSPRLFMKSWFLSPNYRRQRTIVTGAFVVLAILVILFSTPSVSQFFMRASPTTGPSTYYFGLDANPPWGHLLVDGKSVALISSGAYTLFSLSRGRHTLTWRAAPFAQQQCVLIVPVDTGSATCLFPADAPDLPGNINAYIRFPTNVSMLSATQSAALLKQAQAVLDRQQSSETVRVGELYAQTLETAGPSTRSCTVLQIAAVCFAAARLPLKATLRLKLDIGVSRDTPCAAGVCDSGNQQCQLFCDLPAYVGFDRTLAPTVWQATVLVHLLWQFDTIEGKVVEENQADSFILGQPNALSVLLNITWNGQQWGVTPASKNGSFGSNAPVCDAASGDMYTLLSASSPVYAEPQRVSGPTLASGCLLKISPPPDVNGLPTPTTVPSKVAYVIQRFGVLLAVDATAHHMWPFLPVADAYALQVAQQLITTK